MIEVHAAAFRSLAGIRRLISPPQMPHSVRLASASFLHSRRTGQPEQISFACFWEPPGPGNQMFVSIPKQAALGHQLGSSTGSLLAGRSLGAKSLCSSPPNGFSLRGLLRLRVSGTGPAGLSRGAQFVSSGHDMTRRRLGWGGAGRLLGRIRGAKSRSMFTPRDQAEPRRRDVPPGATGAPSWPSSASVWSSEPADSTGASWALSGRRNPRVSKVLTFLSSSGTWPGFVKVTGKSCFAIAEVLLLVVGDPFGPLRMISQKSSLGL